MVSLPAVQAKHELAVLASASVALLLNSGQGAATGQRTPAEVVHLGNGVVEGELLVLVEQVRGKLHGVQVQVVHGSFARRLGTANLADLALLYLLSHFLDDAVHAEEVRAARHKEELVP